MCDDTLKFAKTLIFLICFNLKIDIFNIFSLLILDKLINKTIMIMTLIQFERSFSLLRFQFNETKTNDKKNSDSSISFINTTKLFTT